MTENIWISPDKKIKKEILEYGSFGLKPIEYSICTAIITDVNNERKLSSEYFNNKEEQIIISEGNTAIDREIDKCLLTMQKGELSFVTFNLTYQNADVEVNFNMKLCDFEPKKYIYNWSADEKCKTALNHKEKGVELFRQKRYIDASHRFSKGLKLLLSIPIPVDEKPEHIDDIIISDLDNFKANLYNNLASCYIKENKNDEVIELCNKVLEFDKENCKAICKRGFAYVAIKEYEKAKIDLENVLEVEKENKAVIEKLQFVNNKLNEQDANFVCMVKKMFGK